MTPKHIILSHKISVTRLEIPGCHDPWIWRRHFVYHEMFLILLRSAKYIHKHVLFGKFLIAEHLAWYNFSVLDLIWKEPTSRPHEIVCPFFQGMLFHIVKKMLQIIDLVSAKDNSIEILLERFSKRIKNCSECRAETFFLWANFWIELCSNFRYFTVTDFCSSVHEPGNVLTWYINLERIWINRDGDCHCTCQ
jgi:hypothetical protein